MTNFAAGSRKGTIEQAQTVRLVVFGVIFFLASTVVIDSISMAAMPDYYFHQLPEDGVFFIVLGVLNLVAIYGAWRRKSWGYILAIVLALVVLVPTLQAVMFLGNLNKIGSAGVFYTITMTVIRLMVVFFAASALLLRRPSAQP